MIETHIELDLRHLRPLITIGSKRIAQFDGFRLCSEFLEKLVVYALLYVYTRASTTSLAVVPANGIRS
jgi:hypothetical protein